MGLTLFLDFDGYILSSLEQSPFKVEQSNTKEFFDEDHCLLLSLLKRNSLKLVVG